LQKFKKYRKLLSLLAVTVAVLLLVAVLPVGALSYTTVEGTYSFSGVYTKYLGDTSRPNLPAEVLTITTQTNKVISEATLTCFGKDISLTGLVGPGSKPWISLVGTDSDGTNVIVNARLTKNSRGNITGMAGRLDGFVTSDGYRWDSSVTGTGAATLSTAAYHSGAYSTLLTGGNETEAVVLQLNHPSSTLKLSDLDTLTATSKKGISFWFLLANTTTPGPQIGLRFAPVGVTGTDLFSSVSHVDVTLAPYYSLTGNGTWQQCTITKDTARWFYYGNDPENQTAISGSNVTGTLSQVEAAVNADAEMVRHEASASSWVLTAVYIDLYESGARTCYIDDVKVGTTTYALEPYRIAGTFSASYAALAPR